MNYGAGEPLDELKVQFCLLHRHQKTLDSVAYIQPGRNNQQQDKQRL